MILHQIAVTRKGGYLPYLWRVELRENFARQWNGNRRCIIGISDSAGAISKPETNTTDPILKRTVQCCAGGIPHVFAFYRVARIDNTSTAHCWCVNTNTDLSMRVDVPTMRPAKPILHGFPLCAPTAEATPRAPGRGGTCRAPTRCLTTPTGLPGSTNDV